MRHIPDHYLDFGCYRKGATDGNETMHKATKRAYKSTNKQLSKLSPQLLSARARIEAVTELGASASIQSTVRSELLITRQPVSVLQQTVEGGQPERNTAENDTVTGETRFATAMSALLHFGSSPNEVHKRIIDFRHPTINLPVWDTVKSIRFLATVPWCPEQKFWQTIYAGDNIFGAVPRDAVQYKLGVQFNYGIVHSVFSHKSRPTSRVAVIRRLEECQPEAGNKLVTDKYGHKKLKYVQALGDIQLDFIPSHSLIRPIMVVPVPWLVSRMYGRGTRMNNLPDDAEARKKFRFFLIFL